MSEDNLTQFYWTARIAACGNIGILRHMTIIEINLFISEKNNLFQKNNNSFRD
jgi:hypothetical protein